MTNLLIYFALALAFLLMGRFFSVKAHARRSIRRVKSEWVGMVLDD